MKRFYRDVTVGRDSDGFTILLDGKMVKTPARAALRVPTATLAEAIADEWRGQGAEIEPHGMTLTKLANTAIDRVGARRETIVDELVRYGAHDLLAYRAEHPAELVAHESTAWDPLLAWVVEQHGVALVTTAGVGHIEQPVESLAALKQVLAARDDLLLAALHTAAAITGSIVLALALADDRLTAAEAFALATVDERYQAEKWGVDAEAVRRHQGLLAEVESAAKFMALSRT